VNEDARLEARGERREAGGETEEPQQAAVVQPLPAEWQAAVGDLIAEACLRRGVPELITTPEQVIGLLERLRDLDASPPAPSPSDDAGERGFLTGSYNRLTDMCGADLGEHLQVVYFLCRGYSGDMAVVKVNVPRDGQVPTATGLWAVANWCEREIAEMFGLTFVGHPSPGHLLLPEGWVGYPLRKDYVYDREHEWTRPDPMREDPGEALGLGEEEETEESE
jgi:NADH:ubiquinone oxidoreductase subunit C